jgi:uncharacterized membrane protein
MKNIINGKKQKLAIIGFAIVALGIAFATLRKFRGKQNVD